MEGYCGQTSLETADQNEACNVLPIFELDLRDSLEERHWLEGMVLLEFGARVSFRAGVTTTEYAS